MAELRKAPGMRERAPNVWELIVEAGRDPVTGKRRQVTRRFHGTLRAAKKARAELIVEVSQGRHVGTSGTVDELFVEWLVELERKGRSPNTVRSYERLYRRNLRPTLGAKPVRNVTTKMLTNPYGAHQARGMAPSSVRKIHATVSSMMTQACRWGWISTNPAQWADPPLLSHSAPTVPTPAEVGSLIKAASESRRPEYGRLLFLAATTGMRRGELLALRWPDIDQDHRIIRVSRSLVDLSHVAVSEGKTKNRRARHVAIDDRTFVVLEEQADMMRDRAIEIGTTLATDGFVFSDSPSGGEPWRPMMVTRYFGRLRTRLGLDHLTFHSLRKFMDTYGQDLGFSSAQVAIRAGHDPVVASRYYTGAVDESDRRLAAAIAGLLP